MSRPLNPQPCAGSDASASDPVSTPLFRAYLERRDDLLRVFTARLRSRERAEDLVQAMAEKVMAVTTDEEIGNPASYLYRLGVNLSLDLARQERRRSVRDNAWASLQGADFGGVQASDAPDAHQTAAARDQLRRLLAAVEALPPKTRRIFQLHKLDGLSHAETARALGVSQSSVEKHVSAALKRLVEKTR